MTLVPAIVRGKPPAGASRFRQPAGAAYHVLAEVLTTEPVFFEIESATAALAPQPTGAAIPLEVAIDGHFLAAELPDDIPPGVYDLTFAFTSAEVVQVSPVPIRVLLTVLEAP